MSQSTSALVIWGHYLPFYVGTGKLTKQVSGMIKFPPYQKGILIGLILSEGWLRFASKTSKNALLGFKQFLSHSEYVWFVFNLLSHYCSSSPKLTTGIILGKRYWGLEFFTRSLPCFTEIHTIFYANGIKIIPEYIYNLLTPVGLAHLIMGGGMVQWYVMV